MERKKSSFFVIQTSRYTRNPSARNEVHRGAGGAFYRFCHHMGVTQEKPVCSESFLFSHDSSDKPKLIVRAIVLKNKKIQIPLEIPLAVHHHMKFLNYSYSIIQYKMETICDYTLS